jgi:hypothetical protein
VAQEEGVAVVSYRTTLALFLAVLLVGAFIGFYERRTESTQERKESARKALRVFAGRVTYLRIETTNLVAECARDDGGWFITQPVRAAADAAEIARLLSALEQCQRGERITPAEQRERELSPADYGLDAPRARITVGDGLRRRTFLVGRDALLGGHLYVKEAGRPDIVAAETNVLAALPSAVGQLRDRTLFHETPEQAQRLEIRHEGGFAQIARDEQGRWMLQQPLAARASPEAVAGMLSDLFALRVEQFVTESGYEPAAYGLDAPDVTVSVWAGDKGGETQLLIGNAMPGSNDLVYARLKSSESIYGIRTNLLGRLRPVLNDLRQRRLLEVSARDLGFVRLDEGERSLVLQKGAAGWEIAEPRQWKADEDRVRDLLSRWAGATIAAFVEGACTNPAEMGFDPPARKLTFSCVSPAAASNDSARVPGADCQVVVLVGSILRPSTNLVVRRADEDGYYEIAPAVMEPVSLDPLFYLDRNVLDLKAEDVERVRQVADGRESVWERDASGRFVSPVAGGAADEESVKDLLAVACRLQAREFVADDPADLSAYGLAQPEAILTLDLRQEAGLSKSVLFGRRAGEGGYYAMVRGRDVVFALDAPFRSVLLKDLRVSPAPPGEKPVDDGAAQPAQP